MVRVKAVDGKFVGTGMGGALVTIQEMLTGKLPAEEITTGSTGDPYQGQGRAPEIKD